MHARAKRAFSVHRASRQPLSAPLLPRRVKTVRLAHTAHWQDNPAACSVLRALTSPIRRARDAIRAHWAIGALVGSAIHVLSTSIRTRARLIRIERASTPASSAQRALQPSERRPHLSKVACARIIILPRHFYLRATEKCVSPVHLTLSAVRLEPQSRRSGSTMASGDQGTKRSNPGLVHTETFARKPPWTLPATMPRAASIACPASLGRFASYASSSRTYLIPLPDSATRAPPQMHSFSLLLYSPSFFWRCSVLATGGGRRQAASLLPSPSV